MPNDDMFTGEESGGGFTITSAISAEEVLHMGYNFMKLMSYYTCAMMEIETKFKVLNEEFSLLWDRQPISSIKTRLKDPISIANKLSRKGLTTSVETVERDLSDVAGVRVVCSFIDDVYMIAEAFKKQDDITVLTEKDYIKNPKENGYRSLHLIVEVPIFLQHEKRSMKVEIQLRTIAMDSWASLEHQLRYKKADVFTAEMAEDLKRCADLSAALDRKMDDLRAEVYPEAPGEEDFLKETLAELPLLANK